jgi:Spy/CpxP family protein refolding chaperone
MPKTFQWRAAVGALALILTLSLAAQQAASAHDTSAGPNGGQVVEVKGHHVELTATGTDLTLHLSDETHAAIASQGASGRAVILDGSRQATAALTPAAPNRLVAHLEAPLAAGARVVVTAKLADGHEIVARFVIK